MENLKQLIKEFRELESKLNSPISEDDSPQIQFEQKCYKDITKLLDAVEILVEGLEYYTERPPKREVTYTHNYCSDDCPRDCSEHIYETKGMAGPACHSMGIARQALQQADERVR